ncbi:FRG domain-containing protein [bacterium]|nr:FRG domain-containing protein [bacterium]
MEKLKGRIVSYLSSSKKCESTTLNEVWEDPGIVVESYADLVAKIARLSFYNPEWVLFFRGQARDFVNKNGTSLRPQIFRAEQGQYLVSPPVLRKRYEKLQRADDMLREMYTYVGKKRIVRHQILRWAILQHYEVCPTPLLDITQSLRVAVTFATCEAENDFAYVYVLAVPQVTGSISTSTEHSLQIIRLSSICPPAARRPHFQEAYLMGMFPPIDSPRQKKEVPIGEVDCSRRLLCKFRVPGSGLSDKGKFGEIPYAALMPVKGDLLLDLCNSIKREIKTRYIINS